MKTRSSSCRLFLSLLLLLLVPPFAAAQVPRTMSYQGVLTDSRGTPVADNQYTILFRLYAAPSGGNSLWAETQTVRVSRGVFSTVLGNITPMQLPFNRQYWLGITLSGGNEMTPRLQLTATPYAVRAARTDTSVEALRLNGFSASASPEANTLLALDGTAKFPLSVIPEVPARIVEGSVTTEKLAVGAVSASRIADSSITAGKLLLPLAIDSRRPAPPLTVVNLGTAIDARSLGAEAVTATGLAASPAVKGVNNHANGTGVAGSADAGPGATGVLGSSTLGRGVAGTSKSNDGVRGTSASGYGVVGYSTDGSAGVLGKTDHENGTGVMGAADVGSNAAGVFGISAAGSGIYGKSSAGDGVRGFTDGRYGVSGHSTQSVGVYGSSTAKEGVSGVTTGQNAAGVHGVADRGVSSAGVLGESASGTGVSGYTSNGSAGVRGESGRTDGTGVSGVANFGTAAVGVRGSSHRGTGVVGESDTTDGVGVFGRANGPLARGVVGMSRMGVGLFGRTDEGPAAVEGIAFADSASGVWGRNDNPAGRGVSGESDAGAGIYGRSKQGTAGLFDGAVRVNGPLAAAGGTRQPVAWIERIDSRDSTHLVTEEAVSSPEQRSIYDGIAVLDSAGQAIVSLPAYAGGTGTVYRYQLTCIGGYAPVFIAREVTDNSFMIAGGSNGMRVSWQVAVVKLRVGSKQ